MKPSPSPNPAAEDQAALWAARLDGSDLSSDDRAALDAWLAAAPDHRALLSSYCQFSANLEQQMPLLAGIGDQVAEIPPAPRLASSRPWSRWPIWAGATLAAAAAVALVFHIASPAARVETTVTAVGQRQTLALTDGSSVELNAHTSLRVEFTRTERRVRLASGQAFFTVTPDAARPFLVETPDGTVRVTGTAFDVLAAPATLHVTVASGKVRVRPLRAEPVDLLPGSQLAIDGDNIVQRTLDAAALERALAWRQGLAIFAGTRLDEALALLARYHGRTFHAAPEVAARTVGGRFSLDDLDGFFSGIEDSLQVKVRRDENGGYLVVPAHAP
ncbi:MAG: FecR domain-containing protein [Opitutae bacterium]|nr:FecR domain-containing protein [Opitutae bacterium]